MGTAKRERQKAGRQARLAQAQVTKARKQRFKLVRNLAILAVVLVVGLFLYVQATDDDDGGDELSTGDTTSTTPSTDDTTAPGDTSSTTGTTVAGEPEAFTYGEGPCPAPDGSSEQTLDFESAPQLCIDPARSYTAVFDTTAGTVRVALDTTATPGATNNFVALARYHYYDETDLFRTNTGIGIIQGGSPHTQDNSDPGPGYTIPDEGFGDDVVLAGGGGPYTYEAGDLVYARPGGTPDSSSAQFFFCATDACAGLDSQGIYVEFGRVTEGLDVLQAILDSAPEGEGAPDPIPVVRSVTIEEA